jgi:hypothetical protein
VCLNKKIVTKKLSASRPRSECTFQDQVHELIVSSEYSGDPAPSIQANQHLLVKKSDSRKRDRDEEEKLVRDQSQPNGWHTASSLVLLLPWWLVGVGEAKRTKKNKTMG